jgi:SAM-dependent methyltransferase
VLDVSGAHAGAASAAIARGGDVVEASVWDAERLPFPSESFDVVTSCFGVIHARDARRAAAELDRVLRPAGRIGITAWAPSGLMGRALGLAADRLGRIEARTASRWGRYEDAYRRFGFHPGFEMSDHALPFDAPSVSRAVETLTGAPGPLNPLGASEAGLESRLEILLDAGARRTDGGIVVELDYVLIRARKPTA